jgi:hypothetical protein
MRRDRYVMQGFALAAALVFPAATALAGPPGGQGEVVAKYYENLGGTDLFQIDANGNLQWDGKAGGDAVAVVATGAGPGRPFAGRDGAPCKQVDASVFCDLNRNGAWDGNGGGDFAATFSPGVGNGIVFFVDLNNNGTPELVKYVPGTPDFFQVDDNENNVWNGTGGGDKVVSVAPGAGPGVPFVCDCAGNGTLELGKYVPATSTVYVDLNNNGAWNGNGGGDRAFSFAPGAGEGTFLFANLGGSDAYETIKYYSSLGGSDVFQIDLNNNNVWNGNGGGDATAVVAPGAGAGEPCVIDLEGSGTYVLCKIKSDTSTVFIDKNGNRAWDGNGGGDAAGAFAPGAGTGTFVLLSAPE